MLSEKKKKPEDKVILQVKYSNISYNRKHTMKVK